MFHLVLRLSLWSFWFQLWEGETVCVCVSMSLRAWLISAYLSSSWLINILDINTKFLCGLLMDPKCICSWPSSCTHICVDPRWQCWDLLCANTMYCLLYTLSGVNSLNGQCALARVVCWTVLVVLVLTVCSHIVHTLRFNSVAKQKCLVLRYFLVILRDSTPLMCHGRCNTVQRRSHVI